MANSEEEGVPEIPPSKPSVPSDPYLLGIWVPCALCEDYVCVRHHRHVADCDCPPLEDWICE